MQLQKTRRNRGAILTSQGWDKLQAAKIQAEFDESFRHFKKAVSEQTPES